MIRRLLLSYVSITLLVLAALVLPLGTGFANRESDVLLGRIESDAQAVAALAEEDLEAGRTPSLEGLLTAYAVDGIRVVVVDAHGISVADSEEIAGSRRDFSTRPEFAAALAGRRDEGTRWSETLHRNFMYVAIPTTSGGKIHGAVRISYPMTELDARVRSYWIRLGVLSAGVLGAVVAVGFLLARGVTRPVQDLQRVARELSQGRLDARATTDSGAPELRALAGTVNVMAERLTRLVGSQRLFVADAAHQLRTPLTALRLRLETLEMHLPADQRPKLDAALAEGERLGRLVDALLALAGADAGVTPPGPVAATEVVARRLEAWRIAAAAQGIRLAFVEPQEGRGDPAVVLAAPGSLEQILDNLLSNAIAVSRPGGEVVVRLVLDGGRAQIRITDEGPGMSDAERERAFEPFWRGRDARPGSGFGLGLAIARRLAEAGGGTVTLGPGPGGRGTTAVVTLSLGPACSPRTALTRG